MREAADSVVTLLAAAIRYRRASGHGGPMTHDEERAWEAALDGLLVAAAAAADYAETHA